MHLLVSTLVLYLHHRGNRFRTLGHIILMQNNNKNVPALGRLSNTILRISSSSTFCPVPPPPCLFLPPTSPPSTWEDVFGGSKNIASIFCQGYFVGEYLGRVQKTFFTQLSILCFYLFLKIKSGVSELVVGRIFFAS